MNYNELSDTVEKYFTSEKYCCAESVLMGILDYYNIAYTDEQIRIFAGFGGGLGGSGCTCGTLIGAAAAIGFNFHDEKEIKIVEDKEVKQIVSRNLTKEIHDYFKQQYRITCCRGLKKKGLDKKASRVICTGINKDIAVQTAKIIDEQKKNSQ